MYWDKSIKIPHEYVFSYRLMRNYNQCLTLKFVNSIWKEYIKTEGIVWSKEDKIFPCKISLDSSSCIFLKIFYYTYLEIFRFKICFKNCTKNK